MVRGVFVGVVSLLCCALGCSWCCRVWFVVVVVVVCVVVCMAGVVLLLFVLCALWCLCVGVRVLLCV